MMLKEDLMVGNRIKKLRVDRGMTLVVLSSKLGISATALHKIESCQTDVNLSRLYQLAEVFDIWIGELISDDLTTAPSKELKISYTKLNTADEKILSLRNKIALLRKQLNKD